MFYLDCVPSFPMDRYSRCASGHVIDLKSQVTAVLIRLRHSRLSLMPRRGCPATWTHCPHVTDVVNTWGAVRVLHDGRAITWCDFARFPHLAWWVAGQPPRASCDTSGSRRWMWEPGFISGLSNIYTPYTKCQSQAISMRRPVIVARNLLISLS